MVILFREISQTNITKFRETLSIWWARALSLPKSNRTRLKRPGKYHAEIGQLLRTRSGSDFKSNRKTQKRAIDTMFHAKLGQELRSRSGSRFPSNRKTQKRAAVTRVHTKLGQVCELDPGHASNQI
jgi:hypothetical protein